jgi:hypothetical protein
MHGYGRLGIAHQRFVRLHGVQGVLPLPAFATEVAKTDPLTTEVRSLLQAAGRTQRIFKVWVHLNLHTSNYNYKGMRELAKPNDRTGDTMKMT